MSRYQLQELVIFQVVFYSFYENIHQHGIQLIYIYKSGICLEPVNTTTKGEGPPGKENLFLLT